MTESESKIGHLEEEALKRKEKLKNLKRKRVEESQDEKQKYFEAVTLPKPSFRSYKPLNENLNEFVLDPAEPGNVNDVVKDQLESAKSTVVIDQLDVTSLAPRKPDWDLKRDVAKKLAKLEKQTQRAIAEIIRDRLKESTQREDLAALVNAAASNGS